MGTTTDTGRGAVENILEHVGVKGMKWGVRKDRKSSKNQRDVTVVTKPGKGVVKTTGGKGHTPSEDALRKATVKQKAKGSSTDALSNEELKRVVERMNLEQQYKKLSSQQKTQSAGAKFVKGLIKNETESLQRGKPGPVVSAIMAGLTVALGAKVGASAGASSAARNASKASGQVVVGKVLSSTTKIIK
jgi:hypothetical protein